MAATRLIAMHQNKGKSVGQCLKDRTDYAKISKFEEDFCVTDHARILMSSWNLTIESKSYSNYFFNYLD